MKEKIRISWIDQMRGLSMIGVYFAHVNISTYYYGLFCFWLIPCFFFISGYLHKDDVTIKKTANKIFRILIPYIIFTLLLFSNQIIKDINLSNISNNFLKLITGRGIWFFACFVVVEIIAFFISKLINIYIKYRNSIILSVIIIGFIAMNLVQPRSQMWWHIDTAICSISYYYSGYLFQYFLLQKIPYSRFDYIILPVLTIISLLIYIYKVLDFNVSINIYGQPLINLPMAIIGSIATALFLRRINLGYFITFIGQNTIWLYGVNYYMLSFSDQIYSQIGLIHLNPYIYVPIKVMTSIILGCLLVIPINRWVPWINGKY